MRVIMAETIETIKARNPVREAFAGCSTGSVRVRSRNDRIYAGYYDSKGHAVNTFDDELQTFDLCLDRDDLMDFHGNEGRKVVEVHNGFDRCVGRAVFSWHRMESGRWEFIGYLA